VMNLCRFDRFQEVLMCFCHNFASFRSVESPSPRQAHLHPNPRWSGGDFLLNKNDI